MAAEFGTSVTALLVMGSTRLLGRRSKSDSIKCIIRKLCAHWIMLLVSNVVLVCALQCEDTLLTITPKAKAPVELILPPSYSTK